MKCWFAGRWRSFYIALRLAAFALSKPGTATLPLGFFTCACSKVPTHDLEITPFNFRGNLRPLVCSRIRALAACPAASLTAGSAIKKPQSGQRKVTGNYRRSNVNPASFTTSRFSGISLVRTQSPAPIASSRASDKTFEVRRQYKQHGISQQFIQRVSRNPIEYFYVSLACARNVRL